MLTKSLYLEIDKPNYVPIYTVQYDYNSRFYEITILNNSQPLDLTGIRVIVAGKKPDGKEVFNSCKVLDAKKGLIQLELTEQMNAVNGASEYALELFSADGMLSSQPFKLIVTRSTISKSVESSKELGALKDALNEVQDIDNRFAQTNAQLSTKASKNYIWSMANMGQDVREAMTGGSVAVVEGESVLDENIVPNSIKSYHMSDWFSQYADEIDIKFVKGAISSSNGSIQNSTTRISSKSPIFVKKGTVISLSDYSDARFFIHYYNSDESYINGAGWFTQDFTIKSDTYISLTVSNINEKTLTSIRELGGLVLVKNSDGLEKRFDGLKSLDSKIENMELLTLEFIVGNCDGNGMVVVGNSRIANPSLCFMKKGTVIKSAVGYDDLQFYIHIFDKITDKKSTFQVGWINDDYIIPQDGYVRILVKNKTEVSLSSPDLLANKVRIHLTTSDFTNVIQKVNDMVVVKENVSNLDSKIENMTKISVEYEIGNLTGQGLNLDNSDSRIRNTSLCFMKKGTAIKSIIGYSDLRFYFHIFDEITDKTSTVQSGWINDDYIIPQDGYVRFIVCNKTEVSLNDVALADNVVILAPETSYNNLIQKIENISLEISDNSDFLITNGNFTYVKSIAHKGYELEAPENTISAFKLAKKNGFDYVETDIRFTSDGIPVLLHDATINRTSNGSGYIREITLNKAKTYDFGSWMSTKYAGEKILTLEEYILLCKKLNLHPYLEFKGHETAEGATGLSKSEVQKCVNIVKNMGMLKNVTWISGAIELASYVWEIDPNARFGVLIFGLSSFELFKNTYYEQYGYANHDFFIDIDYNLLTDNVKQDLISRGWETEVFTVTSESVVDDLLTTHITGITTSHINLKKVYDY